MKLLTGIFSVLAHYSLITHASPHTLNSTHLLNCTNAVKNSKPFHYDHLIKIGATDAMLPDIIYAKDDDTIAFAFMEDKQSVVSGYWETNGLDNLACFPSIPRQKCKWWSGEVRVKSPGDHIFVVKLRKGCDWPIPIYSANKEYGCKQGLVGLITPKNWDLSRAFPILAEYKIDAAEAQLAWAPEKDPFGGELKAVASPLDEGEK